MALSTGTRLGPYEILAPLGAGGMGEVYRARDSKLGREVAIKVLPEEFTQHPQKLARFEREARLLAALNHPGIATLYGVEEAENQPFLVMELVEGETLADRISRGAVPVDEALTIAQQIAEALEAAHEKGVIHRDLKPANIKVDPEGNVKVLDFGLAKAFADEVPESELSQSPTLSRDATRAGVILGTAAYMSPEQAKGKTVDKRTDIFSFGIVLYEMLTGKRAFGGEDVSDVLAAIIRAEPDWKELPNDVDPRIGNLLRRCLRKDRKNRRQSIGDVRIELQEIQAQPQSAQHSDSSITTWRQKLFWSVVGGLVVAITAALLRPSPVSPPATRFAIPLPGDVDLTHTGRRAVALSPDGRKLAFPTTGGIYVRDFARVESEALPGTEGGRDLAFAPDGQWIAFWSNQGQAIKKVALTGGAPVPLCTAQNPYGLSWDTEDWIYFAQGPAGIFRVSAFGGESEQVVEVQRGEEAGFPQFLPERDQLLFTLRGGDAGDGVIVSQMLGTDDSSVVFRGRDGRYIHTGHLVTAREDSLELVPFDLDRLQASRGPVPFVQGILESTAGIGTAQYTISESGSLAYIRGDAGNTQLRWIDREGVRTDLGVSGAYQAARLSPDGTRVAMQLDSDIWLYDISRGTTTRLTFTGDNGFPVWTIDGSKVIFSSRRNGPDQVFWKATDGSTEAEALTSGNNARHPDAVSFDGSLLAFHEHSEASDNTWILPLDGEREPIPFLMSEFGEIPGAFSPDGRWLAFDSNSSGQREVYITPYPGPGARIPVSTNGGNGAIWSRDGREIFYRESDQVVMVVDVTLDPTPKFGTPKRLFQASLAGPSVRSLSYSPVPDASRFLIGEFEGGSFRRIEVVLNWFSELERLVPTD